MWRDWTGRDIGHAVARRDRALRRTDMMSCSPQALARRRPRAALYPDVTERRERSRPRLGVWLVGVCGSGLLLSWLAADFVATVGPWTVPVVLLSAAGLARSRWNRGRRR